MVILGIILLIIGLVLGVRLLTAAGAVLLVVGIILDVSAGVWHVGTALF